MTDPSTQTALGFVEALDTISPIWSEKQNKTRHLTNLSDSLEQMVTAGLLRESIGKHLDANPLMPHSVVVFMDRKGKGEGAKVSSTVIQMLGERFPGISYVHIAFSTPSRGIGSLMRSSLARKGAESGVLVDVIAHKHPAQGLTLTPDDASKLLANVSLTITYAPEGMAGLLDFDNIGSDPFISRSHINLLSFPDPEYAVADLPKYETVIATRPGFNAIRFWAQKYEDPGYTELGHCLLTKTGDGDAHDRLWVLLDNAKRHPYRLLAEPIAHNVPIGNPLHYPCKTLLKQHKNLGMTIDRIVTAGSNLLVVGHGLNFSKSSG